MNEIYYFTIVFIDLALALFAFRLGRQWLIGYIVANLILVTALSGKVVEVFGLATTIGGPFYAAIFLATDVLTEHYGKSVGHKSVWIGFFTLAMFVLFGNLSLLVAPVDFSADLHAAMQTVFGVSLRISFASIIAYIISQNYDVWFYHLLKTKTEGRRLWLRNNLTTTTSQIIDSAIFFSIAFYGVLPNWIEVAIVGAVIKILIAFLDTPFIYLSRLISTLDKPEPPQATAEVQA